MSLNIEIRKISSHELPEALDIWTDAFLTDPTIEAILIKDASGYSERVRKFLQIYLYFIRENDLLGLGAFNNGELKGVLFGYHYYEENEEASNKYITQLEENFDRSVSSRIFKYFDGASPIKPQESFFLDFIGVRKDSQGQGIGSILLKNIIETCKQNNKIKYIALDTANPKNVTLYTRVGFNTIAVKEFSNNLTQTVMTYSL